MAVTPRPYQALKPVAKPYYQGTKDLQKPIYVPYCSKKALIEAVLKLVLRNALASAKGVVISCKTTGEGGRTLPSERGAGMLSLL